MLNPSQIEYPQPFVSEWMDDGSMTIDLGQRFTVHVDETGFHAKKESGPWPVEDLFGEMGYWPENIFWTGSGDNLNDLLEQVSTAAGIQMSNLLPLVVSYFSENHDFDLTAYLNEEEDGEELLGEHQIPGLPSPEFEEGTFYRGLELVFSEDGWSASLFEPDSDSEMFLPDIWQASTFEELMADSDEGDSLADVLPWSQDEFAEILIESDERWSKFV